MTAIIHNKQVNRRIRRFRKAYVDARIAKQMFGEDSSIAKTASTRAAALGNELASEIGWPEVDRITEGMIK